MLPADDTCDDELDNDCNGVADEGCPCTSGASRGCYDGPAQTRSIGECTDGHQDCVNDLWAAECVGSVLPEPESCNGLDSDCNGIADEDCSCVDGEIRPCYSGPPTTNGTGNCHSGSQTCTATAWPAGCPGEVLPTTESCDASDEDCDGVVDSSDCLVRVERFWNTDICSHQYKTGSITPDAGYVLEPGNHFYVYTTAVPGTVPLYQMSDGARHLVTLDPNEGTALGYNIASTLGYVVPDGSASWNAGGLGASPICRYTTTVCSDHVLWLASELPAPGYTQEVCLGFVWGWLG